MRFLLACVLAGNMILPLHAEEPEPETGEISEAVQEIKEPDSSEKQEKEDSPSDETINTQPESTSEETPDEEAVNEVQLEAESTAEPASEAEADLKEEPDTQTEKAEPQETSEPDAETDPSAEENEDEAAEEMPEEEAENEETEPEEAETEKQEPAGPYANRLIVISEEPPREEDAVISSFDQMYLLGFESEEAMNEAYAYYLEHALHAEPDGIVSVAEGSDLNDAPNEISEENNPIDQLQSLLEEENSAAEHEQNLIALIDTGAPQGYEAIISSVSVLGENGSDDNGHGTRMTDYILEENPAARILSVKAFDSSGTGTISSVFAAVEYAMEQGASVIALCASAAANSENSILLDKIRAANETGITVVGASGNNGLSTRYFIPALSEEAVIAGSCDAEGTIRSFSNYGETIDYLVVSDSTSEAAARTAGILAAGDMNTRSNIFRYVFSQENRGHGEPFSTEDEDFHVQCNNFYYGDVYYWQIPKGATTTADAVLIEGYQQETLNSKTDRANGYDVQFQSVADEPFTPGHGYAIFASTHKPDAVSEWGASVHETDFKGKYEAWGRQFNSSKTYTITRKQIPNRTYKGVLVRQDDTSAPGVRNVSSLSASVSGTAKIGEEGAIYWDDAEEISPEYWQGWEHTAAGDRYASFRMDFYYEGEDPSYNLTINYLEENTNRVLATKYGPAKLKQGASYSVPSPSITNYELVNASQATVAGTMPGNDHTINVYYRTVNFNLTINYLEENTNKVLAAKYGPTLKKKGTAYSVPSPSITNYELVNASQATVAGTMPANDHTVNVYYRSVYHIDTKVINGMITLSNAMEQAGTTGDSTYNASGSIINISAGQNKTVRYTNRPDHFMDYVKVDGSAVDAKTYPSAYAFTNIKANHTVEVRYAPSPLTTTSKTVKNAAGKVIDGKMVRADDVLTYEITMRNTFTGTKRFTVADRIPQGTVYVDGSASDSGSHQNGVLNWAFDLAQNAEKTVRFKVRVLPAAKGSIVTNSADVAANGHTFKTNTVTNPVLPDPIKEIQNKKKEDINGQMVDLQDVLCYRITVTNPAAEGKTFVIRDAINENQTVQPAAISDGGSLQNGSIIWRVTIGAKSSKTVTFEATANHTGVTIPNTAFVTVDDLPETETNRTVVYVPVPPVKTAKSETGVLLNGKAVRLNDAFVYEINVENNADTEKTFRVTDDVPSPLKILSAGELNEGYAEGGCGASVSGQTVSWQMSLPAKAKKTLYIRVRLTETDVSFTNTVTELVDQAEIISEPVDNWAGRIVINAEISSYWAPFGQPSFLYAIRDREGSGDLWYRMIIIDPAVKKGQAVFDVPTGHDADTWIIQDEEGSRYHFVKAAPETANVTVDGNRSAARINAGERLGIADYFYTIPRWDETSHLDAKINRVEYRRS